MLANLAEDSRAARELTGDPGWGVAATAPWIGPQLAAFAKVATSVDDLISHSLLPLTREAGGMSLDVLQPINGRIDSTALASLAGPARTSAEHAAHAAAEVRDIDRAPLVGKMAESVDQAGVVLADAAKAIDALARTAELLPSMLGGDEPREYLVLVQNNSEWRSLGGITGTAITLQTDHGAISLGETRSATLLSRGITDPIVDLPSDVFALYGTRPARYFHNLTQIPDFTIDGPLARAMYAQQTGVEVDGVIAVDPVGLSYLLGATGPVSLQDGGQISEKNAAQVLLSAVYQRFSEPSDQDAFFAQTTSAVFASLIEGRASPSKLVSAFSRAADERRLYLWNADENEQAVLDGSSIAGSLNETDSRTARFGVYLNDGTGSKMSFYMKPSITLEWDSCKTSPIVQSRQATLRLNLANVAPADAANVLPPFVTGNGAYGVPPGTARTVVNILVPGGYEVVASNASNASSIISGSLGTQQVLTFSTDTAPGASMSAMVVVRGTSPAVTLEALVTPTADASLSPVISERCKARSSFGGTLE